MIEANVVTGRTRNLRQLLIPISLPSFKTMLALYSFQNSESQGQRDHFTVKKLKKIWNKDPTVHVGTAEYLSLNLGIQRKKILEQTELQD